MSIITAEKIAGPLNGQKQAQSLQQQGATGIILFTSTGQLLFMNTEAQAFTDNCNPYRPERTAPVSFPKRSIP